MVLDAVGALAPAAAWARSIAFYPGDRLPLEALSWFQEVVVDPAKVSDPELAALRRGGTLSIARIAPATWPPAAPPPRPC